MLVTTTADVTAIELGCGHYPSFGGNSEAIRKWNEREQDR